MINQISLALTTYNRANLPYEALKFICGDPRLKEIIVVDDCSNLSIFNKLQKKLNKLNSKITLIRNAENKGVSANKHIAVQACSSEFVLLFDSDNIIYSNYLDAFYILESWIDTNIYVPELALPKFDYTHFSGKLINSNNICEFLDKPFFDNLLNTGNYIVPRNNYLKVYQEKKDIGGADVIFFAYLWLDAGFNIKVVDNMCYYHRVHKNSYYLKSCEHNNKMFKLCINAMKLSFDKY